MILAGEGDIVCVKCGLPVPDELGECNDPAKCRVYRQTVKPEDRNDGYSNREN